MDEWDEGAVGAGEAARIVQRCRHDALTRRGSALDAVRLATGCSRGHAGAVLHRALAEDPELARLAVTEQVLGGRKCLCMHLDDLHTLAGALLARRALLPPSVAERDGAVYAVSSPLLAAVKVGMWRGDARALRKRYATMYGNDLTLDIFEVDDCRRAEKEAHAHLAPHHLTNELFAPAALETFRAWCTARGYARRAE